MACRILVPQPETEPPALEVQSLNHWTTREVPGPHFWSCQMTDYTIILAVLVTELEFHIMDGFVKNQSLIFCIQRWATKASVQWSQVYVCIIFISTFTFHFHALEKEMAAHSSVLAWRIPGTGEPGGLPSLGSHRVRHVWSDLAAAALCVFTELGD